MSSGSNGIPGVWNARNGKKGVETIMTELSEFTICSVDELKGSLCSITERRVSELIPVLGSQPAGDVSHKPGGRLPLVAWHSGRTSVSSRRTFPVLRSTCS